jgi:hypothetical protein
MLDKEYITAVGNFRTTKNNLAYSKINVQLRIVVSFSGRQLLYNSK